MSCDCLIDCGDDPGLKSGRATPCEHRMKELRCPRVLLIERGQDPARVVVHLSHRPDDGEFRWLCNLISHFGPPR